MGECVGALGDGEAASLFFLGGGVEGFGGDGGVCEGWEIGGTDWGCLWLFWDKGRGEKGENGGNNWGLLIGENKILIGGIF